MNIAAQTVELRHGDMGELGAMPLVRAENGDVVARMMAICGVMVGKKSQSSPAKLTRLTIGSAAAFAFIAQPSRSGSTN